jgi:hypothetical protein
MQLSFIELLYVSAQPLHKVNITKGNPIEGYAVLALLGREKLVLTRLGECCLPRAP